MHSDDSFLAVMAAYALAESGDKDGAAFIENILHSNPTMFVPQQNMPDTETLQELLNICDDLNVTFDMYNSSYLIDTKNKILRILNTIYDKPLLATGIEHFDNMLGFIFKRSRGIFVDMLAMCELHLGNIENAFNYSLEAVSIAEELGEAKLLKLAYSDLGQIHMSLGNYYSALELTQKSLEIDDNSHDPRRKRNRTLANLSHLYYQIGDNDKSLEYGLEALELSEKEHDIVGTARCLNALGVISSNLNELQNSEEYFDQALNLAAGELHNRSLQGLILHNLAWLRYSAGEYENARKHLCDALNLSLEMSDKSTEGMIRTSLAMLELDDGNADEAHTQAELALNIYKKLYSPSGQSDALYILGTLEHFINDDPLAAYDYYREAVQFSETLRENLLLDDFKISFAGNYISLYQQMISLCVRMGKTEEVFEYSERSKSRAFVDMFSSVSDTVSAKVLKPEQVERIANLKGRMSLIGRQISASYTDANNNLSDCRKHELESEINELEEAYLRTFQELKTKDPEWLSLISVGVADIEAVQSSLDEKTVLLEFYQTGESLFVIVISKNNLPSVLNIPIDNDVESERLFNLFAAISTGNGLDTRSHDFIKQVKNPLSYFHELLIVPLREHIRDIDHLIIVPHYFWHYLPFHALYDRASEEYLIDRLTVSYAPSATALDLCCRKGNSRYRSALILANPSNDLPYAEEEAEKIAAKFGNTGFLYKGEQASLDKLEAYADADIVHFACHGYFRGDEPLFSHLLLKDSEGETSPVFLPDIFNLRLNASLVTLSACETGASQFTAGDELMGLSRAFFYAGTTSLLSSLWSVNDKSTALLMDTFYEGLLREDKTRAESLRSAILELKAMTEYRHPYFWSPFFLSGDWR